MKIVLEKVFDNFYKIRGLPRTRPHAVQHVKRIGCQIAVEKQPVVVFQVYRNQNILELSQLNLFPVDNSLQFGEVVLIISFHVLKHCEKECAKGKRIHL